MREYAEMSLGQVSEQRIIRQMLLNSGFDYSGSRTIKGLSGHDHLFDAVGVRGKNVALVLSGPKDLDLRPKGSDHISPKLRSEIWCRDALFRMYDVAAIMDREGIKTDLVIFENRLTRFLPKSGPVFGGDEDIAAWVSRHSLPTDWAMNWQLSYTHIDVPSPRYLPESGQAAGACYFGLDDFTLAEIAGICSTDVIAATTATSAAMKRVRVDQYFNPPTDELILSAIALSKRKDLDIVTDFYRASAELQHRPVENVFVRDTDYTDPVATALALKKEGMIEYSAEVRLTVDGREVTQRISKSPQEHFVIRLAKSLALPEVAKALMQVLKGH